MVLCDVVCCVLLFDLWCAAVWFRIVFGAWFSQVVCVLMGCDVVICEVVVCSLV